MKPKAERLRSKTMSGPVEGLGLDPEAITTDLETGRWLSMYSVQPDRRSRLRRRPPVITGPCSPQGSPPQRAAYRVSDRHTGSSSPASSPDVRREPSPCSATQLRPRLTGPVEVRGPRDPRCGLLRRHRFAGQILAGQRAELCYGEHLLEAGKMISRLESIWYAIEHPLGPSRELGSYANHQESVEQLIREMNARVIPIEYGLEPRAGQPIPSAH